MEQYILKNICFPGEITQIVTHFLEQTCLAHGCYTLNQLQCLLRLGGGHSATSVVERLLFYLDEQGLVLSSPWPYRDGPLSMAELWPRMWAAWTERQKWAGCRALSAEVGIPRTVFEHVRDWLRCGSGPHGTWLQRDELSRSHCSFTVKEYSSLTSWLNRNNT